MGKTGCVVWKLHEEGKRRNAQNPRQINKYLIHVGYVNICWSSLFAELVSCLTRTALEFGLEVFSFRSTLVFTLFFTCQVFLWKGQEICDNIYVFIVQAEIYCIVAYRLVAKR